MPIVYDAEGVPPPPPPPPRPPRTPVVPTFTWTSASGRVTLLSQFGGLSSGVMVTPGATGLGMPEWSLYETSSPGFDGSTVRSVRASARDINLPIHAWGPSRSSLVETYHRLIADMNPRKGLGTLTITNPVGNSSRSIAAYYTGGLQGQDDDAAWGMTHITAVLALRAPQPYWLGTAKTASFQIAAASNFFPLLPLRISQSQVLDRVEITNDGDADTYPVFTVRGPATSITLTNATTGQTLTVDQSLSVGQVLVVDTREGRKSVVQDGTTNRYASLSSNSVMWPLVEGRNQVTVSIPGSTPATQLTLSHQTRYLTAY